MRLAIHNVGFQQVEKRSYSRHKSAVFSILNQIFITKKMSAYRLALRELSQNASAALQFLERTSHCLQIAPCSGILIKL
jgi:hypothetical protein